MLFLLEFSIIVLNFRERYMKFKVKLACFDDLQPGELVAQRLQKMEKEANFITTCPDVEIPPSKWYVLVHGTFRVFECWTQVLV